MLARDIAIVDIEPEHWQGWFEMLVPARVRNHPHWGLAILDHGKPLTITVHTGVANSRPASLEHPAFSGTSPDALDRLAEELAVEAIVVVERDILAALHAAIDRALVQLGDGADHVAQWLAILRVLQRHHGQGLWSSPALLDLLPPLSYDALQSTFDLCIPDDTSMLCYVFAEKRPRIHSSVIAVKRHGDITHVASHTGVADLISEQLLADDWLMQHRRLTAAVSQRYAPPSLAVFLAHSAFHRIVTGPADQLAREMNARNVIIDPAPAWLLGLLGGATVAAMATRSARALARMLPRSARRMAADLATTAQTVMRESGTHPFALLGFDPIEFWHSIRHFYR